MKSIPPESRTANTTKGPLLPAFGAVMGWALAALITYVLLQLSQITSKADLQRLLSLQILTLISVLVFGVIKRRLEAIQRILHPFPWVMVLFADCIIVSTAFFPPVQNSSPGPRLFLLAAGIIATLILAILMIRGNWNNEVIGLAWIAFFTTIMFTPAYVYTAVGDLVLLATLLYVAGQAPLDVWDGLSRKIMLLLTATALLILGSTIWARESFGAIWGAAHYLAGLIAIVVTASIIQRRSDGLILACAIAGGVLLNAAYGLACLPFVLSSNASNVTKTWLGSLNPNAVGGFLVGALPILAMSALEMKSKFGRTIMLLAASLGLGLLIESASRGAVVGAASAFGVLLVQTLRGRWHVNIAGAAAGILAAVVGVVLLGWLLGYAGPLRGHIPDTLNARYVLWSAAGDFLVHSPLQSWIHGVGWKQNNLVSTWDFGNTAGLSDLIRAQGPYLHTHNVVAEVLLSGGLALLITLGALCLVTMAKTRHAVGASPIQIGAVAALTGLAAHGVVDYMFNDSGTLLIAGVSAGLLLREAGDGRRHTAAKWVAILPGLAVLTAIPAALHSSQLPVIRRSHMLSAAMVRPVTHGCKTFPSPSTSGEYYSQLRRANQELEKVRHRFVLSPEAMYMEASVAESLWRMDKDADLKDKAKVAYQDCISKSHAPSLCMQGLARLIQQDDPVTAAALEQEASRLDPQGLTKVQCNDR